MEKFFSTRHSQLGSAQHPSSSVPLRTLLPGCYTSMEKLCCTFYMSWRSCGNRRASQITGVPLLARHWRLLGALLYYDKPYLIHRLVSRNLSPVRQQWEELRCLQDTLCALKVHLLPPFLSWNWLCYNGRSLATMPHYKRFRRQLAHQSLKILCHWPWQ